MVSSINSYYTKQGFLLLLFRQPKKPNRRQKSGKKKADLAAFMPFISMDRGFEATQSPSTFKLP
jgi:hypothetical protein